MLLPDPAIASTPEPAASETAPGWIGSWASNKGAATLETPAPAPPPGDAPPPHTAPYLNGGGSWSGMGRGPAGACACAQSGAGTPPASSSPESRGHPQTFSYDRGSRWSLGEDSAP